MVFSTNPELIQLTQHLLTMASRRLALVDPVLSHHIAIKARIHPINSREQKIKTRVKVYRSETLKLLVDEIRIT
jgi:hypothetical protein